MLDPRVSEYLNSRREQFLADLFELLRIPGIANIDADPDPCRLCAEWLARRLEALAFRTEIVPTPGKPCLIASAHVGDDRPTVLIYGHYDVQPPEPVELWHSDPFDPVIRDGCIYARGANDDKGQLFAHLAAIEAWRKAGGGLPVNIKILLEGEEEVGSPNLEPLIQQHKDDLAADAAVISDSEFHKRGAPAITYALRGVTYAEVTFRGPSADLHSGLHGGAVTNPINALAACIAAMHDANGRVTLPGFYDDVLPLADQERRRWDGLGFDEAAYAASLGVQQLGGGEKGRGVLERRWARPTLDCNGIVGGHTGAGEKTIIPSRAAAKVSMRLVPDQDPHKIIEALRRFVASHTPPGVRSSLDSGAEVRPVLLKTDTPEMSAAGAALAEAFGRSPVFIRCGASVPVTEVLQRLLGLDAVLMGFGLPDDNIHSPNERFRLDQLWGGCLAAAAFLQNLAHETTPRVHP